MNLTTDPFNKIASGQKVIESRLFDKKRQQIKVGDHIIFSENDNPEHSVETLVINLFQYQTFMELFAHHDAKLFGESSSEFLHKQIRQFYSEDEERAFGVIGIQVELLDKALVD